MAKITKIPPRRPDWHARLSAYLTAVVHRPFRPGQHDCALFVAGAVEAMTGTDAAATWRGTYRSLHGGRIALQKAGFSDHVALVTAYFPEISPAFAAVGDLAVLRGDGDGAALGVVQGSAVYVLHPGGMALMSRLLIEKAFRV